MRTLTVLGVAGAAGLLAAPYLWQLSIAALPFTAIISLASRWPPWTWLFPANLGVMVGLAFVIDMTH